MKRHFCIICEETLTAEETCDACKAEAYGDLIAKKAGKGKKHSPGEWRFEPEKIHPSGHIAGRGPKVYLGDSNRSITIHGDHPDAVANAHLIAAAPDLLTACEEILRCTSIDERWLKPIRQAITKARGEK